MRIIQTTSKSNYDFDMKVIEGAILLQDKVDYRKKLEPGSNTIPTKEKPDEAESGSV